MKYLRHVWRFALGSTLCESNFAFVFPRCGVCLRIAFPPAGEFVSMSALSLQLWMMSLCRATVQGLNEQVWYFTDTLEIKTHCVCPSNLYVMRTILSLLSVTCRTNINVAFARSFQSFFYLSFVFLYFVSSPPIVSTNFPETNSIYLVLSILDYTIRTDKQPRQQ